MPGEDPHPRPRHRSPVLPDHAAVHGHPSEREDVFLVRADRNDLLRPEGSGGVEHFGPPRSRSRQPCLEAAAPVGEALDARRQDVGSEGAQHGTTAHARHIAVVYLPQQPDRGRQFQSHLVCGTFLRDLENSVQVRATGAHVAKPHLHPAGRDVFESELPCLAQRDLSGCDPRCGEAGHERHVGVLGHPPHLAFHAHAAAEQKLHSERSLARGDVDPPLCRRTSGGASHDGEAARRYPVENTLTVPAGDAREALGCVRQSGQLHVGPRDGCRSRPGSDRDRHSCAPAQCDPLGDRARFQHPAVVPGQESVRVDAGSVAARQHAREVQLAALIGAAPEIPADGACGTLDSLGGPHGHLRSLHGPASFIGDRHGERDRWLQLDLHVPLGEGRDLPPPGRVPIGRDPERHGVGEERFHAAAPVLVLDEACLPFLDAGLVQPLHRRVRCEGVRGHGLPVARRPHDRAEHVRALQAHGRRKDFGCLADAATTAMGRCGHGEGDGRARRWRGEGGAARRIGDVGPHRATVHCHLDTGRRDWLPPFVLDRDDDSLGVALQAERIDAVGTPGEEHRSGQHQTAGRRELAPHRHGLAPAPVRCKTLHRGRLSQQHPHRSVFSNLHPTTHAHELERHTAGRRLASELGHELFLARCQPLRMGAREGPLPEWGAVVLPGCHPGTEGSHPDKRPIAGRHRQPPRVFRRIESVLAPSAANSEPTRDPPAVCQHRKGVAAVLRSVDHDLLGAPRHGIRDPIAIGHGPSHRPSRSRQSRRCSPSTSQVPSAPQGAMPTNPGGRCCSSSAAGNGQEDSGRSVAGSAEGSGRRRTTRAWRSTHHTAVPPRAIHLSSLPAGGTAPSAKRSTGVSPTKTRAEGWPPPPPAASRLAERSASSTGVSDVPRSGFEVWFRTLLLVERNATTSAVLWASDRPGDAFLASWATSAHPRTRHGAASCRARWHCQVAPRRALDFAARLTACSGAAVTARSLGGQ